MGQGQVNSLFECQAFCLYQKDCGAIQYDFDAKGCTLVLGTLLLQIGGSCAPAAPRELIYMPTKQGVSFHQSMVSFRAPSNTAMCFSVEGGEVLATIEDIVEIVCLTLCENDPVCLGFEFRSNLLPPRRPPGDTRNTQFGACRFFATRKLQIDESGTDCSYIDLPDHATDSVLYVKTNEVYPQRQFLALEHCAPNANVLAQLSSDDIIHNIPSLENCQQECDLASCHILYYDITEEKCYLFRNALWTNCRVPEEIVPVHVAHSILEVLEVVELLDNEEQIIQAGPVVVASGPHSDLITLGPVPTQDSCTTLCDITENCHAFTFNTTMGTCTLSSIPDFEAEEQQVFRENFEIAGKYLTIENRCLPIGPRPVVAGAAKIPSGASSPTKIECSALCERTPGCTGFTFNGGCELLTAIFAEVCENGQEPTPFAVSPTNQYRDAFRQLPRSMCILPGTPQISISDEVQDMIVVRDECEETCFDLARCRAYSFEDSVCRAFTHASIVECDSLSSQDANLYVGAYLEVLDAFYRIEDEFVPGEVVIGVAQGVDSAQDCTALCDVYSDCISVKYNGDTEQCDLLSGSGVTLPDHTNSTAVSEEVVMLTVTASYPLTELGNSKTKDGARVRFCDPTSLSELISLNDSDETSLADCQAICDAHMDCQGLVFNPAPGDNKGRSGTCTLVTTLSICFNELSVPANARYFVKFRNFLNEEEQVWNLGLQHENGLCLSYGILLWPQENDAEQAASVTSFPHCQHLCDALKCDGVAFDEVEESCRLYGSGTSVGRAECPTTSTVREAFRFSIADFQPNPKKSVLSSQPIALLPHKTKEECASLCDSTYDCEAFTVTIGKRSLQPGEVLVPGTPLLSAGTGTQQFARIEPNGNFVVYNMQGDALSVLWSSTGTEFKGRFVTLSLDGDFQIMGEDRTVLFEQPNTSDTENVELQVDRFGLVLRNLDNNQVVWKLTKSATPEVTSTNKYGYTCEDFRIRGMCCGSGPCFGYSWKTGDNGPPADCHACHGGKPALYKLARSVCYRDGSQIGQAISGIDSFNKISQCRDACDDSSECQAFQYNRKDSLCTLHRNPPPTTMRRCDGIFEQTDTYYLSGLPFVEGVLEMQELLSVGDRLLPNSTAPQYFSMLAGDGKWVIVDSSSEQRWWESTGHAPASVISFRSTDLKLSMLDDLERIVWEVPISVNFQHLNLILSNFGYLELFGALVIEERADETIPLVTEKVPIWGAAPALKSQDDGTVPVGDCALFDSSIKLVDNPFSTVFTYASQFKFTKLEDRCVSGAPMDFGNGDSPLNNMPLEACKRLCSMVDTCEAFEHTGDRTCKLYERSDFFCTADGETGTDRVSLYLDYSFIDDKPMDSWTEYYMSGKGAFKPHAQLGSSQVELDGDYELKVSNGTLEITDADRRNMMKCRNICARYDDCHGFEWRITQQWNPAMWKQRADAKCHFITREFNSSAVTTGTFLMTRVDVSTKFHQLTKPVCMSDERNLDVFRDKSLEECKAIMVAHPLAVSFEFGKASSAAVGDCILKSVLPSLRTDECTPEHLFSYKQQLYDVFFDPRAFYKDVPAFNLPKATAMGLPKIFPSQVKHTVQTYETCAETCSSLPQEACAMFFFTGGDKGSSAGTSSKVFERERIINDESLLCLQVVPGSTSREMEARVCSPRDEQHITQLGADRLGIWGTSLCLEADHDELLGRLFVRECDDSQPLQRWDIQLDTTGLLVSTANGKCLSVTQARSWNAPQSMSETLNRYSTTIPDASQLRSSIKLVDCEQAQNHKWQWASSDVQLQDKAFRSVSVPFAELIWSTFGAVRSERVAFMYHFRSKTIAMGGLLLYGNCLEITDPEFLTVEPWNRCDLSGSRQTQLWNYDAQRSKIESIGYPNKCLRGQGFLVPDNGICSATENDGQSRRLAKEDYQNLLNKATRSNDPQLFMSIMFSFLFISRPLSIAMDDCSDSDRSQEFFPEHACILYAATTTEPSPVENLGVPGKCLHAQIHDGSDPQVTLEPCTDRKTAQWSFDLDKQRLYYAPDMQHCLTLDVNYFDVVHDSAKEVPVRVLDCKESTNSSSVLQWWLTSDPWNGVLDGSQGTTLESPLQSGRNKMFRLEPGRPGGDIPESRVHSYSADLGSQPSSLKQQWQAYELPEVRTSPFQFVSRRSVAIRPNDKLSKLSDPEVQFHLWFFSNEARLAKKLLRRAEALSELSVLVSKSVSLLTEDLAKGIGLLSTFDLAISEMNPVVEKLDKFVGTVSERLQQLQFSTGLLGRIFSGFKFMLTVGWKLIYSTLRGLNKILPVMTALSAVVTIAGSITGTVVQSTLGPSAAIEEIANVLVRASKCSHDVDREANTEDASEAVGNIIHLVLRTSSAMESLLQTVESIVEPMQVIRRRIQNVYGGILKVIRGMFAVFEGIEGFQFFLEFMEMGVDIPVVGRITVGDIISAIGIIITALSIMFFGFTAPAIDLLISVIMTLIEKHISLPSLLPEAFGKMEMDWLDQLEDDLEKKISEQVDQLTEVLQSLINDLPDLPFDSENCNLGENISGLIPKKPDLQQLLKEATEEKIAEDKEADMEEGASDDSNRRLIDEAEDQALYETLHPHTHMYEHGVVNKYIDPLHRDDARRQLVSITFVPAGLSYKKIASDPKGLLKPLIVTVVGNALAPDDDEMKRKDEAGKRKSKTSRRRRTMAKQSSRGSSAIFKKIKKNKRMKAALTKLLGTRKKNGKEGGDMPGVKRTMLVMNRLDGTGTDAGASISYILLDTTDRNAKAFSNTSKRKSTSSPREYFSPDDAHLVYTFREPNDGSRKTPAPPVCAMKVSAYRGIPKIRPSISFVKSRYPGVPPEVRLWLRSSHFMVIPLQSVFQDRKDRRIRPLGDTATPRYSLYDVGELHRLERKGLVTKEKSKSARSGVNRCLNGAIHLKPKLQSTTVAGTQCKFVVNALSRRSPLWLWSDWNCLAKTKDFDSLAVGVDTKSGRRLVTKEFAVENAANEILAQLTGNKHSAIDVSKLESRMQHTQTFHRFWGKTRDWEKWFFIEDTYGGTLFGHELPSTNELCPKAPLKIKGDHADNYYTAQSTATKDFKIAVNECYDGVKAEKEKICPDDVTFCGAGKYAKKNGKKFSKKLEGSDNPAFFGGTDKGTDITVLKQVHYCVEASPWFSKLYKRIGWKVGRSCGIVTPPTANWDQTVNDKYKKAIPKIPGTTDIGDTAKSNTLYKSPNPPSSVLNGNFEIKLKKSGGSTFSFPESQFHNVEHIIDNVQFFFDHKENNGQGNQKGCKNSVPNFIMAGSIWNQEMAVYHPWELMDEKFCVYGWEIMYKTFIGLLKACLGFEFNSTKDYWKLSERGNMKTFLEECSKGDQTELKGNTNTHQNPYGIKLHIRGYCAKLLEYWDKANNYRSDKCDPEKTKRNKIIMSSKKATDLGLSERRLSTDDGFARNSGFVNSPRWVRRKLIDAEQQRDEEGRGLIVDEEMITDFVRHDHFAIDEVATHGRSLPGEIGDQEKKENVVLVSDYMTQDMVDVICIEWNTMQIITRDETASLKYLCGKDESDSKNPLRKEWNESLEYFLSKRGFLNYGEDIAKIGTRDHYFYACHFVNQAGCDKDDIKIWNEDKLTDYKAVFPNDGTTCDFYRVQFEQVDDKKRKSTVNVVISFAEKDACKSSEQFVVTALGSEPVREDKEFAVVIVRGFRDQLDVKDKKVREKVKDAGQLMLYNQSQNKKQKTQFV